MATALANVRDGAQVFDRIGAFLREQGLDPVPVHYGFAYRLLSEPDGMLARAVAALTADGVRLRPADITALTGETAPAPAPAAQASAHEGDLLVARTQMQVADFEDMMQAMQAETRGFGADLAARRDAIGRDGVAVSVAELIRMTGAMEDRVRAGEARLDAARAEASELRAQLEAARGDALTDPLTGLPNRRAFEETYAARVARAAPFCVALCDIDRFKRVNDTFGHAVGDRVLKVIAEALSEGGGALVARYGGEEFAVLFDHADEAAAEGVLDAARASVAGKRYKLRESDEPLGAITFSGGLTVASPDELMGAALGRADRLLYRAKAEGRNRICR